METAGQRLVRVYVDACNELGHPEMIAMKGHVARRTKELLDLECEQERLERTVLTFVQRRGRTALQLAEIYAELAQEELVNPAERPSVRRLARAWVQKYGWPTGAKFVRGFHAGTYVYDPLGLDRLPPGYVGWSHPRPSFNDICAAVSSQ